MENTWSCFLVYCCSMVAICLSTMAAAQTNISTDQSALLALKAQITNDPYNMISTNWSATTPICNWVGVTCGARHHRVAVLNLSYMELTGTIPPELGNLSFLVELRFTNNSFHGSLPQELSHLRRLKFISVGFNKLIGVIPSWLGSLSKLQYLYLFGNKLSGSIPAAIFNLSELEVIHLSYNQLSGSIPREIGNLTMLKESYFDDNNFTKIPNEIGGLDQLEKLFVQNNGLEGNVPVVVFNMSSLITLTLFGNHLKGRLPDNMCQNIPHIQVLDLAENQLGGPLPSIYWHCKRLVNLYLGENNFKGSIPKTIGNATQLKLVYLEHNNLTGSIPHEIGDLPNLEKLVLGTNHLNGLIPNAIYNISTIKLIAVGDNQLSGSLPPSFGIGLPNLQKFILGLNKVGGVIPASISNASRLTFIDLGDNLLDGFIPSTFCALVNLEVLELFGNNLTLDTTTPEVNVLSCLANLTKLRSLALDSNPLNTSLPTTFWNLSTSLQDVYLFNCNLRGKIPDDIGNLSSLIVLAMYDNKLSGSIPPSIGTLKNLQGLILSGNELEGHIPDELCQLQNIVYLALDHNQLSNPIPSCLGLHTTLRSLHLGSNFFTSTIPSTLWRLSDILLLNLSSNNLSGSFSEDVGSFKAIVAIDLSNNHISGNIPSNIGNLKSLVDLSLGNNKLDGLIPTSLGKSLSLELLDLSNNSLSGMIPKSLESLKYLKVLNLSFNMFYGEIPTGGPFQNFSAQSFVSSGRLCGASRFSVPACKNSTFEAHSSKSSGSMLKYIIPGVLVALFMVIFIWIVILRRRKNVKAATTETAFLPQHLWRRVSQLELTRATNAFDESNLLGSGGFGSVYKGSFSDGIEVAIKVFNLELEAAFKSFDIECQMLGNIRHRNLINIISCCSQINFKAVVLKYMPNGSLEMWLHSQNLCLNILQRLSIMIDVALAIEYLHHGYGTPIVHCDLKPSNILLDEDMSAHVADFGIAKLLGGGDSMTQTITQATIGYMAPEYGMDGIITTRGDVYSFGIVLMETFTGKKPTDEKFDGEMSLKQWVANSPLLDVVDNNLQVTEAEDREFVNKCECLSSIIRLSLACSANSPEERVNIQDVVATLNKIKVKFFKDTARGGVLNRSLV